MKGGIGDIMKQAQKMQAQMQQAQQEVANITVEGESGGGMVKVTLTGQHECKRVQIDNALFEDEKDMLEDLIAAAINDAAHKVEATSKEKMAGVSAGMSLPPGFKLPF